MPRRKTEQPAPLERFHLPDGTEVSIVDKTCWPVGRGQHAARDFEIKRMEPIIEKIVDIYMKPNGPKEVEEILYSASNFARYLSLMGVFGEDGKDDTNARKFWYKKINSRLQTYISCIKNTALDRKILGTSTTHLR